MRAFPCSLQAAGASRLLAAIAVTAAALLTLPNAASAQDVDAAVHKANLYIETVKLTEQAADSWDRYASWVNMKTGPTGKERYISYGLYEVYNGSLKAARDAARLQPEASPLDAAMQRYIDAYEALAPVLNQATAYYDRRGYQTDGVAEGKALHGRMVPLANAFLTEREAMLPQLRAFIRDVEVQELAATEAREGRSRAWHVANVMHAVNIIVDLFPHERPKPIDADTLDQMMMSIGPDTPGAALDAIIAGVVPPTGVVIDMQRFEPALKGYAEAVEAFDRFAAENAEGLASFRRVPRQLLNALQALQQPLQRHQGRDFDGSGPLVGQVVQAYAEMLSTASQLTSSRLRYLP